MTWRPSVVSSGSSHCLGRPDKVASLKHEIPSLIDMSRSEGFDHADEPRTLTG